MRRVYTAAIATLALLGAVEAQAGDYTRTRYPIVLVHGVTGFNTIGGLVNYFHTIPWNLERSGAKGRGAPRSRAEYALSRSSNVFFWLQASTTLW